MRVPIPAEYLPLSDPVREVLGAIDQNVESVIRDARQSQRPTLCSISVEISGSGALFDERVLVHPDGALQLLDPGMPPRSRTSRASREK